MLLSAERICYVWISRRPAQFRAVAAALRPRVEDAAVGALQFLFYVFKAVQLAVFAGWCYRQGDGTLWPPDADGPWLVLGATLLLTGQILNVAVFHRLGRVGVFYGNRFGHDLPWHTGFPFSVVEHPQYVGAVLSIWGLFLTLRFPHDDWFVLPVLETVYYAVGAALED